MVDSEDYFLASLSSLHYMIKDLDLAIKAGKQRYYNPMLDGIVSVLKETLHEFSSDSSVSHRFSVEFTKDLGLLDMCINCNESIDTKVFKCLIAISFYDRLNYY